MRAFHSRGHPVYNGGMESDPDLRMNKTVFSVASLSDPDDAPAYWLSKSPEERLRAMEVMRQIIYGYTHTSARLQRVLTVAKREGDY